MAKQAAKRASKKKAAAKRELIAPRGDKRYIRRDVAGRIKESDDVSRSLSQDRRRKATKAAKRGRAIGATASQRRRNPPGKHRVPTDSLTFNLFGENAL